MFKKHILLTITFQSSYYCKHISVANSCCDGKFLNIPHTQNTTDTSLKIKPNWYFLNVLFLFFDLIGFPKINGIISSSIQSWYNRKKM